MTEQTIDEYFNKVIELETLCNNPLTTATQLNTFMNELATINNNLETELDTLPFPTTVQHLRKLILLEFERNNSFIQSNLLKLIRLKESYTDEYIELNYPANSINSSNSNDRINFSLNYVSQIIDVKQTVNNIMNNCSCMSNRINIIQNINRCQ